MKEPAACIDLVAQARQLALHTPGRNSTYWFRRGLAAADERGAVGDPVVVACGNYLAGRLDAEQAKVLARPQPSQVLAGLDEAVAAIREQLAADAPPASAI